MSLITPEWDLSRPVHKDSHLPWYLPSINKMVARPMGRTVREMRPGNNPQSFPDPEKLNFLLKSGFFYYPRCLYSAGVAELDIPTSQTNDRSILSRDKTNTFIMTDSGGYQAAVDTLKIDWKDPEPTLLKILRWQEHMANVGMHLDVPIGACRQENSHFYQNRNGCLEQSKANFEFFEAHRSKDFPLITPIHGASIAEAINWYEAVKKHPCCGWAVGGHLTQDYGTTLLLLDHIIRDGGFQGERGQFFHIFGKGTGKHGIVATVLQTALRRYANDETIVTFDSSSPIKMGGRFAKVFKEPVFKPNEQIIAQDMDQFCEAIDDLNPKKPYPYCYSPVLEGIAVEDILNPLSKSKYGMDGLAYAILAVHNTFIAVQSVYQTIHNALAEFELITQQLQEAKKSEKQIDPFVSWSDIHSKGDVGAWLYTLIVATNEVFSQANHDAAAIAATIKWKDLFAEALDLTDNTLDEDERLVGMEAVEGKEVSNV
ncbi:MAG: hypothetical protein ACPGOV_13450 [Magnetovibrionaceae bacterium]